MTGQELLKYILEDGMIDSVYLQEQIELKKRKDLLNKHPYAIWQGYDGRWYTYFPDGERKRVRKGRGTQKDIENLIIAFWKDKEENPTVEEMFDEWLGQKGCHNVQRQTIDRYQRDFDKYFSGIKNEKLKNLGKCELDDYFTDMVFSNNMTAKAFSNVRILMRGIWRRASKKEIVNFNIDNVINEMEVSKNDFRRPEKKPQVYTDSEKTMMISYLKDNLDIINMGLLLLFATGLRIGELAALKWEDIIGSNKIQVSRTEISYKVGDRKYTYEVRDFPKTEAGKRKVIVPDDFIPYLMRLRLFAQSSQWLFEKDGHRVKAQQFRTRLNYICVKKLGIVPKSPHKIRKTYASCLIDAHLPDSLIIEQMGHTDIETTKKHYYDNHFDQNEIVKLIGGLKVV